MSFPRAVSWLVAFLMLPSSANSCALSPCGAAWTGMIEFGQTHVVRQNDTRLAPKPVAERATEMLFTPVDGGYHPPSTAQVGHTAQSLTTVGPSCGRR
jgi:hypothetical protein